MLLLFEEFAIVRSRKFEKQNPIKRDYHSKIWFWNFIPSFSLHIPQIQRNCFLFIGFVSPFPFPFPFLWALKSKTKLWLWIIKFIGIYANISHTNAYPLPKSITLNACVLCAPLKCGVKLEFLAKHKWRNEWMNEGKKKVIKN